jgi:DNA invertase Pin-like site-specific DNA recombinase
MNTSNTAKVGIYTRVSSEEQLLNMSLASQEEVCRDYCERCGFSVVAVFREEGKSAKTTDRPEFQRLLRYCLEHRGDIDVVLVHNLKRFARNTEDHLRTKRVLRELGVNLRSVTEPFDDSPGGTFSETVIAAAGQFDNDNKARLSIERMKLALQRGRWTHGPPLGYRKPLGGREYASLEPDPATAPLVRRAFELCATGRYSVSEVARKLSTMGLRGTRGAPLSSQSLGNQLRNPLYCGRMVVRKWDVDVAGDFEPLVSPELFERVQAVLGGKPPPLTEHRVDHPDFPLKQTVKCSACRRYLTGSWSRSRGRRYAYYHCQPPIKCDMLRLRRGALEDSFAQLLEGFALKPHFLGLFREILKDAWQEHTRQHASGRTILRRRLARLEERKLKLEETYVFESRISAETYNGLLSKLLQEKGDVEIELARPEPQALPLEAVLDFAVTLLSAPDRAWRAFPLESKQLFQRLLFPEGIEFDGQTFRTAVTSPVFTALQASAARNERLASLILESWNRVEPWLDEVAALHIPSN